VLNFKKPARVIIVAAVALVVILSMGFAINRVTAVTGDYDFYNFSVNGFMLGADTNEMDTSALTPAEPLHVSDGYDFNYEEVRYNTDANTGRLIKMFVNAYDGAYIPSVTIHKDEGPIYIPYNLNTIEQVIDVFGQGAGGWQDREQRLRYMEYRQEEGRLSATVRFVYTDGESDGINHRLVWVIADSSLPYPYPGEITERIRDKENPKASISPDILPKETSTENSSGAKIIDNVSADLKSSHSDIEITNEWISEDFGYTVLFGSLKSDPQQGIAVVIPTGEQSDKSEHRVLTPSKHGAIKGDSLGAKASMLDVVAEDGYKWIFNVYNGFDAKN
jgi:hypothetical protein